MTNKNYKEETKNQILQISKEIFLDYVTPVSAFMKLRQKHKHSYLLESAESNSSIGNNSFIGLGAIKIFEVKGNVLKIISENSETLEITQAPLNDIQKHLYKLGINKNSHDKMSSVAVGYMTYNSVRFFEKIPLSHERELDFPDMIFVVPKTAIIFGPRNSIKIISNIFQDNSNSSDNSDCIRSIEKELSSGYDFANNEVKGTNKDIRFRSNMTKEQYEEMVVKAKEYIKNGDIFQVVLSQKWEAEAEIDPFEVYRNIRIVNPSPYMFFLNFEDITLVGASPEVMVKGNDSEVILRPIAGTRPRGKNFHEDAELEKDLINDKKEIAEHTMLLDLGRNDIGKISKPKSVRIDEFMVIEKYSHVMHIVSQVRGELIDNTGINDIFASTFPAGTVSGAPKIRAMEIIDELEKSERGVYAGAILYLGSNYFDSCIAIRTMFVKGNKIYIQAGAGIVADSVPENEYKESINKASAMFKSIAISIKKNLIIGDDVTLK